MRGASVDNAVVLPFVFLFGLVVGSFLNVCIYRLPRDKSIVSPGSACPQCNTPIRWFDNIPLVSYLILLGKCRHCKAKISPRYFLVELLTGILFVLMFDFGVRHGGVVPGVIYVLFVAALIVCTFIDFELFIILDLITLPGTVIGIILAALVPSLVGASTHLGGLVWSIVGAVVGGGALLGIALLGEFILKKEAMGMGDVKLIMMIGAFVGWKLALLTIFFASLTGSFVGIALILMKKAQIQSKIPFGPYIALGSLIALFFGNRMIAWYLSFIYKTAV